MKKALFTALVLALAVFVMAPTSNASVVIGYPDLGAEGTFTYSGGVFSANLVAQSIDFGDGLGPQLVDAGGYLDFSAAFSSVVNTGGFITGKFGQDTSTDPSFDYYATFGGVEYSLTGHIQYFNIYGMTDQRIGYAEAIIALDTVSNSLIDAFGGTAGMLSLLLNLNSPISEGMFDADFAGRIKSDVGPVPEPATMMLLGSGLVGLAGWGRKKFRK